jgi:hypothetical protein
MVHVLIALVSLGQGTFMYNLLQGLHMAQTVQLPWFPAQAGQLVVKMITVSSFW